VVRAGSDDAACSSLALLLRAVIRAEREGRRVSPRAVPQAPWAEDVWARRYSPAPALPADHDPQTQRGRRSLGALVVVQASIV